MRITNTMTANKMYLNINKNKTRVDEYYNQLTTGKSIQYASDNPIKASRALKFRTTVEEAKQFQRNAEQGYSWLEISENSVGQMEKMMDTIRGLAAQGANDSYDTSDREKIATDIQNLISEMGMQMNQSYGGRYVFSGYKTDTPPVFSEPNQKTYEVTQNMSYLDMQNFKAYSKLGLDDAAQVFDATRIKLPYTNLSNISLTTTANPALQSLPAFPVAASASVTANPAAGTAAFDMTKQAFVLPLGAETDAIATGKISLAGTKHDVLPMPAVGEPIDPTKVYYDAPVAAAPGVAAAPAAFYLPTALKSQYATTGLPLDTPTFDTAKQAFVLPIAAETSVIATGEISIDGKKYDVLPKPAAGQLLDQTKVYYDAPTASVTGVPIAFYLPTNLTNKYAATGLPLDQPMAVGTPVAINPALNPIPAFPVAASTSVTANPAAGTAAFDRTKQAFVLPRGAEIDAIAAGQISLGGTKYNVLPMPAAGVPIDPSKIYYDAPVAAVAAVPGNPADPTDPGVPAVPAAPAAFYLPAALTSQYTTAGVGLPLDPSVAVGTPSATTVKINYMASNAQGAYAPAANEVTYIQDTGELIMGKDVATDLTTLKQVGFQISYDKAGFQAGEINPKVYFDCKDKSPLIISSETGKRFNMDNQSLQYEFGINIRIDVNNLAKDMFTPAMYADLKEFCSFSDSVKISDKRDLEIKYAGAPYNLSGPALDDAVKKQTSEETQKSRAVAQSRFEDLIGALDKHASVISKQRTDLGSRMSRLELIDNRLSDDILSYTDLLSQNEDADYTESAMMLKNTESVYQASLSTGAKVLQTSLVDFLR